MQPANRAHPASEAQPALTPTELGPALAEVFRVVGPLYRHAAHAVSQDEAIEQVSTGVRSVLERLHVAGPETVPTVARAIATSRQFVQRMVNEAVERGLVEMAENPAHKRSRLVTLTDEGRSVIQRITAREQRVLGETSGDLTRGEIDACLRVLRLMLERVQERTGNLD